MMQHVCTSRGACIACPPCVFECVSCVFKCAQCVFECDLCVFECAPCVFECTPCVFQSASCVFKCASQKQIIDFFVFFHVFQPSPAVQKPTTKADSIAASEKPLEENGIVLVNFSPVFNGSQYVCVQCTCYFTIVSSSLKLR